MPYLIFICLCFFRENPFKCSLLCPKEECIQPHFLIIKLSSSVPAMFNSMDDFRINHFFYIVPKVFKTFKCYGLVCRPIRNCHVYINLSIIYLIITSKESLRYQLYTRAFYSKFKEVCLGWHTLCDIYLHSSSI